MISFDNFSLSHEIDWQRNDRCMVMRFFWVKQSLVRKGQRHRDQRPSCKIFMCCKWWAHLNGHTEKKVSHNNGLLKRSKHTLTHSICNEMRREWRAGYSWGDNCQWHRTLPPHSHSHRTQAYFCLFAMHLFVCHTKSQSLKSVMFELDWILASIDFFSTVVDRFSRKIGHRKIFY